MWQAFDLPETILRARSKSHAIAFYLQNTLQLPSQSIYYCMQYVYNWDILLCHDDAP